MQRLLSILAFVALLASSSPALAHPFLDVQPFPVATVQSGQVYDLTLLIFPGDTPVQSMQLDFEISSLPAFSAPTVTLGEGFELIYDQLADPLHFSVVGDFTESPLEAFGTFSVAEITLLAGSPGGTLSILDGSFVVGLENGVPEVFDELPHISNVLDNTIVQVVPEPSGGLLLGAGIAGLAALGRFRGRARR